LNLAEPAKKVKRPCPRSKGCFRKLAPLTARGASVGRSANRRPAGVTTERMRSQEFAGSAPGAAPRRRIPARRVHSHENVLVTSHRGAYNRPSGKRSGSLAKMSRPMRKRFVEFWRDDRGAVSPEWALMATVLVLGSVAVLAATKVAQ